MIKEIFDIEPIQKNALISFVGISFLSFLQLYIFKNELLDRSSFEIIGISLAMAVCWTILNIPSLIVFYNSEAPEEDISKERIINYEKVIFIFGILILSWITLLTYISYELGLCFKDFIRLSIFISIIRFLFWLIYGAFKKSKVNNN